MIDLHVHSCRSDGTFTPSELVDYAIKKGLNAFALTDHDTVDGLDEAISYAESLKKKGVSGVPRIIKGIELSTDLNAKDVHIVGLFIDCESAEFKKYLKEFVDERKNRNIKMCKRLNEFDIPVTYEELEGSVQDAVITRAHFAAWMLENGYVKTKREAFEKYIGNGAPCYVPREKVSPEKAVELVLKADGVPILAHPILYKLPDEELEALVKRLKEKGLMGIEAVYSTYSLDDERKIRRLAKKYHLLLSGGSDFHGANKENIDLGIGMGHLYVDDSILRDIELARKNVLFTDLDGTLFLNDSTVSENMRGKLKNMTDKGHKLVIASGRPLPSIKERIELLNLNFKNMYIVSNNGALITDNMTGEKIFEKKLTPSVIDEVQKICLKKNVHVHSYTEKEIIGLKNDAEMEFYHSRIHMPLITVTDIAKYLRDGAYKVQIISLDNRPLLEEIKEEILCKLPDEVECVFSNDRYLEVLPKDVTKGSAIKVVADLFSMPMSHTYAAGDEENDISMIKAAATGVAMANASEKVKIAADIVTEKTNDEDGLSEILDRFFSE